MLFTSDSRVSLQQELKSFGLNPSDWKILKEQAQTYRVQSKEDRSFIFKGKVKKQGSLLKWDKLELISL